MGCANSKAGADVAVADAYRPPPTSVSLFDISNVEEPWLIAKNKKDADGEDDESEDEEETDDEDDDEEVDEKPAAANKTGAVPLPLLDKLEGYELAPASWSEVSKALEDMKPTLGQQQQQQAPPPPPKKKKKKKKKTTTATTVDQPQAPAQPPQQQPKPAADAAGKKPPSPAPLGFMEAAPAASTRPPPPELTGRRVVKDNPFLARDRESFKAAGGAEAPRWRRRDPFEGCPERRPPGPAGGGVVLYTTSLRGVRRTFEDCERARELVEAACLAAAAGAGGVAAAAAVVDERDVALHGEYLRELRELLAEPSGEAVSVAPPRLFVMGRYVGGAEEVAALAESGKLREMMRWARARGEACAAKDGRGCEGCGGARFVPCWECGGSCRVVAAEGGEVERCGKCNENGLMLCPICH